MKRLVELVVTAAMLTIPAAASSHELRAGAQGSEERSRLRARLMALPLLTVRGLVDYEAAAELYQASRRRVATVRKLIDCLIATVAIREPAAVLHNDRDFETLAHTRLGVGRYRTLRPVP